MQLVTWRGALIPLPQAVAKMAEELWEELWGGGEFIHPTREGCAAMLTPAVVEAGISAIAYTDHILPAVVLLLEAMYDQHCFQQTQANAARRSSTPT